MALFVFSMALASQARILCEFQESYSAHAGHSHTSSTGSHKHDSTSYDGHDHAGSGSQEQNGHHGPGHSHDRPASEADPASVAKLPSGEEDSSSSQKNCCGSMSELPFGRIPDQAQVTPSSLLFIASYVLLPRLPVLTSGHKQQLRLVRQNAPPRFSLSHIPTTVLLI